MNMTDEELQALMMRIVDGLATPEEEQEFLEMTRDDPKWNTELRAYRKIKEVTDEMQLKELPDSYWEGYWASIYRRCERGFGWILFSIGAIVILAFGFWTLFSEFYTDPDVSLILKFGVSAAGLGVIVLLVSIVRERCFARKHERYEKEVDL